MRLEIRSRFTPTRGQTRIFSRYFSGFSSRHFPSRAHTFARRNKCRTYRRVNEFLILSVTNKRIQNEGGTLQWFTCRNKRWKGFYFEQKKKKEKCDSLLAFSGMHLGINSILAGEIFISNFAKKSEQFASRRVANGVNVVHSRLTALVRLIWIWFYTHLARVPDEDRLDEARKKKLITCNKSVRKF